MGSTETVRPPQANQRYCMVFNPASIFVSMRCKPVLWGLCVCHTGMLGLETQSQTLIPESLPISKCRLRNKTMLIYQTAMFGFLLVWPPAAPRRHPLGQGPSDILYQSEDGSATSLTSSQRIDGGLSLDFLSCHLFLHIAVTAKRSTAKPFTIKEGL